MTERRHSYKMAEFAYSLVRDLSENLTDGIRRLIFGSEQRFGSFEVIHVINTMFESIR